MYKILVSKPDGKTPMGKFRRKWENNIKLGILSKSDLKMWIGLVWFRIGIVGGLL